MKNKWKLLEVPIEDIIQTEVNANSMTPKNFEKLVKNIAKSGLSSTIACYKRTSDGKYYLISGNHRYKACVKLGYSTMNILYADECDLSRDEIIALQLSHNTLHGTDDKGILKRLFDEIDNVDFKEFSHISVDDIQVEDMFTGSLVPVSEHFRVSLVLYRHDMEALEELLEIVREESDLSELVLVANGEGTEDAFLDALSAAKDLCNIKSTSIAFSKILELAKAQMVTEVTDKEAVDG